MPGYHWGRSMPWRVNVRSTIELIFGREGRLGTRTIRITAKAANRSHNTVSIQPRQQQSIWHGTKTPSARTGTGTLIAQTMLTVLTQKSRSFSGQEIAAARSKLIRANQ